MAETTATDAPAPASYLAGLRLAGRRVVVVGAGRVVARRLPALLAAGADVVVIAPAANPAVRRLATRGRVAWWRRPYRAGDLTDAWYAMAAADDPACNAAVFAEAEAARIFCVRSDDRHRSSAWTPATADVDGVTVGVLTGDPRRTRRLRDLLAATLRKAGRTGSHRAAA